MRRRRKTVLVVEDSKTMRHLITSTIQSTQQVLVVECETGFDALKMLPKYEFDLIITDINMPDINGLELISFLKSDKRYMNIPLLVVSTEGKEEDVRRGLALGADRYIVKPFDPKQLKEVIKTYLKE